MTDPPTQFDADLYGLTNPNHQAEGETTCWVVPKIKHDEDRPVGPHIRGGWIYRAAGQSDPEHTRHYAALLLAAADAAELLPVPQAPTIDQGETEMTQPPSADPTSKSRHEGVPTMTDADRTEIRKLALNLAREITVAEVATRNLEADPGEHTLRNADRFAQWLETGQMPTQG